jgi:hypothetical protein
LCCFTRFRKFAVLLSRVNLSSFSKGNRVGVFPPANEVAAWAFFWQVHGPKAAQLCAVGGREIAFSRNSGGNDLAQPPGSASDEQQEAEMTEFVIAYFTEHPRAMDTVAGIADWWMPERVRPDQVVMRKVLDRLTQDGLLERIGNGDYAHYRLKSG